MITVNELFSGIGAQASALQRLGIPYNIVRTSDIDKDAVLSYAAVHCGLTEEMINTYADYPTKEQMTKELTEINLGYDFKEDEPYNWFKYLNRKTKYIERYWLACKLSNNIGDISKVQNIEYADFWTYSFPCQSISIAGRQEGIIQGETRSGLLYEVQRLLENAKNNNTLPKYLMLENVKNLVGKKFKQQFDEWVKWLDELGFNTYWQVLNAKDYGIPQNRERVFAISIRKDIDDGSFTFPKPFDSGVRLVNILEDDVEDKYYLNEDIIKRFITSKNSKNSLLFDGCQVGREGKSREYNSFAPTITSRDYKDPRLINQTIIHTTNDKTSTLRVNATLCPIDNAKENIRIRKLTPKECWRLMGFTDEQFTKAQSVCSDSQLYKQAGNSIVVDVLYCIFTNLFGVDVENFTQPQQK